MTQIWRFLLPRAFPWIQILSAYVPPYCIGKASRVAFFTAARGVRAELFHIPLSLFPSAYSMALWITASDYRYTNLRESDC